MANCFGNAVLSAGFGMVSSEATALIKSELGGKRTQRTILRTVLRLAKQGRLALFKIGDWPCIELPEAMPRTRRPING